MYKSSSGNTSCISIHLRPHKPNFGKYILAITRYPIELESYSYPSERGTFKLRKRREKCLYVINFELFTHISVNIIIIIHLLQTRGSYRKHNQTTQEHKRWLVISALQIRRCLQTSNTDMSKSLLQRPQVQRHLPIIIQGSGSERNEGILTSKLRG